MKFIRFTNILKSASLPDLGSFQATILLVAFFLLTGCAKKPDQPEQVVLARVGDRTITLDEFLKRSEYTIRPPFVKGNQYIHKKMVLNGLIAEKLLAMEAGDDNELTRNHEFQNFIQGRQEQAMRKWLYEKEGMSKVEIDDAELNNAYRWAGRAYKVAYFTVPTKAMADSVQALLNDPSNTFEDVYSEIGGDGELPTREVTWQRQGNDAIMDAMYSDTLRVGQTVGPVQAGERAFTAIKVLGWTESIAMSDEQIKLRLNDVKERLYRTKAEKIYIDFVMEVMKGKKLEFDERAFYKVVDIVKPFYLVSEADKQKAFSAKLWQEEDTARVNFDELANDFEAIKDWPMLTIAGETWTVARLRDEISRHPLVFRVQKLSENNFPQQFKLAVVDMVRDKYLTEEAYKRGYDKVNVVEQNTNMWRDQGMSLWRQQEYLRQQGCEYNFNKDYLRIIDEYLNPYIDSLQTKYSDQIAINTDIFDKTELTRIDMFVVEQNVPYPIVVPSFPVLTTDTRLDYGKKMESKTD